MPFHTMVALKEHQGSAQISHTLGSLPFYATCVGIICDVEYTTVAFFNSQARLKGTSRNHLGNGVGIA